LGVVDDSYQGARFAGVEVLDSSSLAGPTLEGRQIRKVIVALGDRRGCLPVDTLVALTAAGVGVNDGSELYEQLTGKVWLGSFSLSSLVFAQTFRKPWITRCLNRAVSLLFAAIGLVIASPLLLALAALIRLESKGPAIFRQWRVGQNGRHFTLYKFRSMRVGSEIVSGTAPAAVDDPRCTRLGKWLRRFRLDELPQLLNILKGDMCFVGPRPFVPEQEKELTESIPHYRQRWMVRPGTTGWAQVHRGYNATVEDNIDKLSYDLFYIKHMSLGLDLVTIMKTAKVVLLGRGGR
jgi:lipopolysaccharide/colanic/teichoic acid biosynthesis glycosyltransferase